MMPVETLRTLFTDTGGGAAIVGRALALAASAGVIGACLFQRAVVGPLGRTGSVTGNVERLVAGVGLAAAMLLALTVPWRVVTQAEVFSSGGDPLMPLVGRVLQTGWGRAAVAQFAGAVLAASGFARARNVRRWGWTVAASGAAVVAAVPAWMGHAAATERWTWLAIGADVAHVGAAGGWAGGVAVLALVARAMAKQADGGALTSRLIAAFRVLALTSATVLLATGAVGALLRLRSPMDLVGTTYGLLFLLKLAIVGVAAAMGRQHSRTAAARATTLGARAVSRSIAVEALVLLTVIAVTAILAGSPPPGSG